MRTSGRSPAPKGAARKAALEFVRTEATAQTLPVVRKKLNADVQTEKIKSYLILDAKTLETGAAEYRAKVARDAAFGNSTTQKKASPSNKKGGTK